MQDASNVSINALIVLVSIIVLAGVLGGWAAYLAQPRVDAETKADPSRQPWLTFLTLGVVASACVPLFLSILKSELIQAIFNAPLSASSYDSYLIFSGLCLIAAFSARNFIESITDQILRKVEEAKRDAAQAKIEATQAAAAANEAIDEIEGADDDDPASADQAVRLLDTTADESEAPGKEARLTPDERRVLQAMLKRTYRTASGIAEDSGIARHRISELLESLADRKLVLPTKSPRTGGARWAISRRGTVALDS